MWEELEKQVYKAETLAYEQLNFEESEKLKAQMMKIEDEINKDYDYNIKEHQILLQKAMLLKIPTPN